MFFQRRPFGRRAILENPFPIATCDIHSCFTVTPLRYCAAVPASGEDFSSLEKECSSKPSRSSPTSPLSPHGGNLRLRTKEKHRARAQSASQALRPAPFQAWDLRRER